jgi:A/G-specific adenine glycosylase
MKKQDVVDQMLYFYDHSKRVLPWRANKNPYYIWISEIMLQQTRVETVIPYFNRFIKTIPSVYELSIIEEDKLMKLWEGLGYYSRARNLQKAAIQIMTHFNGEIPQTKTELESLSGIGPYTSGAILSIAFEQRVPAVDGNVLRVFSRVYGIEDDIKQQTTKTYIKDLVLAHLPATRNGDFNQSIMELGATICIPNGAPLCSICPIQNICKAYEEQTQSRIPFRTKKTKRNMESKTIIVFMYKDMYGIKKRPSKGLLASLYEYETLDDAYSLKDVEQLFKKNVTDMGPSKHIFTHKVWLMNGYLVEIDTPIEEFTFVTREELIETYSIPSAFKAYTNHIVKLKSKKTFSY